MFRKDINTFFLRGHATKFMLGRINDEGRFIGPITCTDHHVRIFISKLFEQLTINIKQ